MSADSRDEDRRLCCSEGRSRAPKPVLNNCKKCAGSCFRERVAHPSDSCSSKPGQPTACDGRGDESACEREGRIQLQVTKVATP